MWPGGGCVRPACRNACVPDLAYALPQWLFISAGVSHVWMQLLKGLGLYFLLMCV